MAIFVRQPAIGRRYPELYNYRIESPWKIERRFNKCMKINGRKFSSKFFLILIFTGVFFSVTFNSPANYSHSPGFYKILANAADTITLPPAAGGDTALRHYIRTMTDIRRRDSLGRLTDTIPDSLRRRLDTSEYKISKDTLQAK
jgi:hypothetical protein